MDDVAKSDDLVISFLDRLAAPAVEAFIQAVLADPVLAQSLGALGTAPENVVAIARNRGFAFSASELTAYVERKLVERLSAEEIGARLRWLASRASGAISDPLPLDEDTPVRLVEIPDGALLDRCGVLQGSVGAARGVSALTPLLTILNETLNRSLEIDNPAEVHRALDAATFATRVIAASEALAIDKRVPPAMALLISALGMDPSDVLWEWPGVRLLWPAAAGGYGRYRKGPTGALAPHRDTWYGSPQHQINVWGPLRPIPSNASLRIMPHWFRRSFDNSSRCYDVFQNMVGLALAPVPYAIADVSGAIAPPLALGDILVFAGQQLHASAPNMSGHTRVSFEFRLLHRADEGAPWTPPNTDYFGVGQIYRGWFDAAGNEVWRL
jgi:predicted ribosomally synthesized peptide with nif11-like leader